MIRTLYHIIIKLPGVLLVVFAVAFSASAQVVVNQCEIMEFTVVQQGADRYTWDIYRDSTVNFAQTKGDVDPVTYFEEGHYEGSTVVVKWLDPGDYFVRVMAWDEVNCTNNLGLYKIKVVESLPEALIEGDSLCAGEPVTVKIVFTGKGPWDVIYTYGNGTMQVNLYGIVEQEYVVSLPPMPVGETDIWIMEVVEYRGACRVINTTPSEKRRVVIFPIPVSSQIYLKE